MMDDSHQYSSKSFPPPPFKDPSASDSGVYTGPPPIPPPPGPAHTWNMFPHQWPPFPPGGPYLPFDPSRPPPGTFETPQYNDIPPPTWTQNEWNPADPHFGGHFPSNPPQNVHSAQAPYQSNFRSDSTNRQNYPFTDRPWPDDYQSNQDQTRSTATTASDEESLQRWKDEQWVQGFLLQISTEDQPPEPPKSKPSIAEFRQKLYGTLQIVSELNKVRQMLEDNLENESVWTETLSKAAELKNIVRERLTSLKDPDCLSSILRKLLLIKKKRARGRRRKIEEREEMQEQEVRRAQREAEVDKWQMKRIQEVEEKNREKELKLAADAVLCEVRKKQADTKRIQDILKSLEKLRKLRKEAAARRGMFPETQSDETFEGHLERLRCLISKRTAIYAAEEKALRVMLEGEQEEERKRDREIRQKKEKEKLLQKKREVDFMLFGAEFPPHHPLQPFQDYYTQAECSLPSLIQIRREWDQFLVPVEHPDGTPVPQGWVLPDQPSDDIWATALEK
ncbi:Programmed cell death protein 7 ES18 [Triplophysa tibetana]|uniref:Programmed cell death protein 7 ES18 n=1 Tax=Triplophysa tibetana TaxID=1572043 RepID=A0A5A9PPB2_9TELE|nr:Programmed cell death protein 7 ES18 [Triplophysa tibetana]